MSTSDADFEDFVRARWTRLVRAAFMLGCSLPSAEDHVQTALFQCWKRWDKIRVADNPDAYVYRVVVNTVLAARRRRWNSEVATDSLADSAVVLRPPEDGLVLRSALRKVPAAQRAVLVLRYLGDMTDAQIAEVLGVNVGTVKSRASRGLAELRKYVPDIEREIIS